MTLEEARAVIERIIKMLNNSALKEYSDKLKEAIEVIVKDREESLWDSVKYEDDRREEHD